MIKLKVGGMILTGFAAFLVAEKALGTVSQAVIGCCEASKWKGYYKCWSKGQAKGDPVPPGYSMTSRPDKADYEVVYDPSGKDHQHDNEPKEEGKRDHSEAVKTVCEAVKTVAEKAIDSLSKRSDEPREASEGQTEAYEDENLFEPDEKSAHECDICEDSKTDGDKSLVDMIDSVFNEEKETDQNETVG